MPRHFAFRGDRLAYTLGILLLSGVAIGLLVAFEGDTHALIPLYSVGVFVSFTHQPVGHGPPLAPRAARGWRWRLGSMPWARSMTAVVLVVVLVAKAPQSLLVAVIIPVLVGDDAVHRAPVPPQPGAARRCSRTCVFGPPPAMSGS